MGLLIPFIITTCAAVILEIILSGVYWNVETIDNTKGSACPSLKYKLYPDITGTDNHLQHVLLLLERMGYKKAAVDDTDWDVLWAHDYPFLNSSLNMHRLLQHQIVNHFPGIGFLTSKVHLSTAALPFMPKAFRLPSQKEDFIKYAESNNEVLFVEKNNQHRHINIVSPNSINLSTSATFIQEFIQRPFLVDGHKFDIGVYVVLTSVNPLIFYIYAGDVLFRYCLAEYYPFDPTDVEKYVVGSDYIPTWKMPSLIKYYQTLGGGMRAAFDAYVRDQHLDPTPIWVQVEQMVRETILSHVPEISRVSKSYEAGTFFELLRFDFIVDENLKVYLMEVNMSPNLSSMHFKPNALLYDQVLYSVFSLVGIGSSLVTGKKFLAEEEIITSHKNIAVYLNDCVRYSCHKSCTKQECELCLPCLNEKQIKILRKAHYEHLHKIDMKRIYPYAVVRKKNNLELDLGDWK